MRGHTTNDNLELLQADQISAGDTVREITDDVLGRSEKQAARR